MSSDLVPYHCNVHSGGSDHHDRNHAVGMYGKRLGTDFIQVK